MISKISLAFCSIPIFITRQVLLVLSVKLSSRNISLNVSNREGIGFLIIFLGLRKNGI